ncbi:SDR family NAD(P)-dependent oxidoreductase [Corynebacterium sp.]|uniref:SDR family NAD(P)-dependent oxidoreductase n=1 Tax=Corynebacterium sp. TaxID=1720 RepID=UPI003B3BA054
MSGAQTSNTPPLVPERTLLVGCGRVGIQVGIRLAELGGCVTGLRRAPSELPDSFEKVAVDLIESPIVPMGHYDAMVITITPSIGRESNLKQGYIESLKGLHDRLPSIPDRVVFVSSTGVFDSSHRGRVLSEVDVPSPTSDRGKLLKNGEEVARELFGAHIIRPAGIYGPGREMIIRKVVEHQPVQYDRMTNRIHEQDLVEAVTRVVTDHRPPHILHAVDLAPAPLQEVVEFVASQLGVEAPPSLPTDGPCGKTFNGELLSAYLGGLTFPSYREGYREILSARAR